jgi:type III restriction-modification system ecoPI, modification subunit
MESKNIVNENIEKISELFPNVIVESNTGKTIDFDLLRQELSNDIVEGTKEKYQLTWPGKKEAMVHSNIPSKSTLRPVKEKSVDFDNTQNIYIEGDNLEVLKILQESYLNKIKCIYIDPPYNTGNDFIYNDKFKKDIDEELLESGQIDEEGNRMVTNNQSNGRFHSDWLSMMFSRLKLVRNLLSDSGIIFVSIDSNELVNLVKILDMIFGESNKLGIISTINNLKGRSDSEFFATCNEFLVVYAKNKEKASIKGFEIDNEEIDNDYKYEDEISKYKPVGFRKTGNGWKREERPYMYMYYPVIEKNGIYNTVSKEEYYKIYDVNKKVFDDEFVNKLKEKYEKQGYKFILPEDENGNCGRWRWGIETFYAEKDINLCFNNAGSLCTKMRATIENGSIRMKSAKTLWYKPEYDTGTGSKILKNVFENQNYFDNPKSLIYIYDILKICLENNDIVLDFFSGSATTAHAVMQLNSEDNGNIKYIMAQLPEKCDENSEAYRNGYKTICEIGEERIRRAGAKIKEETNADIDYGFRVYKVDSTNMKDVYYTANDLEQSNIGEFKENIKEDRTTDDLLTQVILDLGLTLDLNIEEKMIGKNKVYYVAGNSLVACFDDNIDIDIVDKICEYEPYKVVFKDSAFKTDNDKINLKERFKKLLPQRASDKGYISIL